jgi:hypothetical protein
MAALGIATSESALLRWSRRNGIKKQAAWHSPEAREELLRRHQAAQSGDTTETLRAQLEHKDSELRQADRVIRKLRDEGNRDFAFGLMMQQAVEDHFQPAARTTLRSTSPDSKEGSPQTFVAPLADPHYGEFVDPDLAEGVKYDTRIAAERIAVWRDKVIRYAEIRPYEIRELVLPLMGDLVSGNNHEDLDVSNERGIVDQALEIGELIYQAIVDFHSHAPWTIRVRNVIGNHGRLNKIPRHKKKYDNLDYLVGRMVQKMCEMGLDDRVDINIVRGSRQIIEAEGARIALMHGDGVKAQSFAGIPFYSMKAKTDALQAMYRALEIPSVDHVIIGHFHQHIHWPGIVSVCPSFKGPDEFIMDTRFGYQPAGAILQDWHPRYGLTSTNYISLQHVGAHV